MRSLASEEFNMMMQRRMSQENPIQATETEFVQRLQRLTVLAVNRLIYLGRTSCCSFLFWQSQCSAIWKMDSCFWSVEVFERKDNTIDASLMDLTIKTSLSLWFVSRYYVTDNLDTVFIRMNWTSCFNSMLVHSCVNCLNYVHI